MTKLTHTDSQGNARMVDVTDKQVQLRVAKASGHIQLSPGTLQLISGNLLKKGDVLTVAEIAGIQAAKRTSELIPLCHNIVLNKVLVKAALNDNGVTIHSEVRCTGITGVEMEALTAVGVALLTIYDMCKAVDKTMVIGSIHLIEKTKTNLPG
ncbi:MAG TPA: cyclic pyranopterin monophosphate synthase MoaC [Prolixibacteraceae bacterium]|nr:cyclic pyranopterin monophosphate synthase MoaC [Prolixibacteraceae bacterium]